MKQIWKRRAVVAGVLVLVAAAVYLNWRYSDSVEESAKVLGESTLVSSREPVTNAEPVPAEPEKPAENDYFATARLSRKQARDSAISMLQEAEVDA